MTSPYYITQRPRVKKKAKAAKLSSSMTSLPLVDMSGSIAPSAGQTLQPPKMTSSSSSSDLISDYMMTIPESGMAESPKPGRTRSSSASSSSIAYPGAEKPSQAHIDIDLEKKGSDPSGGQLPYDDEASSKKGGEDTAVLVYPSWAYNPVGRIVYAGWQFVKEHFGEGSVGSSIFVLLSATLGAGTLAFPFAFKECGWALAIFLMAVCGLAAFYSIYLLVLCSIITGRNSYEELAHSVFGRATEIVVDISIIIFTWGSTVAYMVIIGDTLPPLMELFGAGDTIMAERWFLLVFSTIFIIFPLTLLSRINSLRHTSLLGFAATAYLLVAVIADTSRRIADDGLDSDRVSAANFSSRIFVGLPIIFYGFSSHVNIFSIYRELKTPTLAKATQVIAGNIIIAFLVYGTLGLFGYLAFLEKTDGNILENYAPENIAIQLGALAMTISVVFYIPLNTHPCRITIDWMITSLSKELAKVDITVRYVVETIIMDALALLIAIAVPNVVVVFGLLGATATSLCCYVMPGLLYIKAANLPWASKEAFLPLCLVTGGTLCGIISTVVIIFDMFEDPGQLE